MILQRKKTLAGILALMLLLTSLAGCAGNTQPQSPDSDTALSQNPVSDTEPASETASATEAETIPETEAETATDVPEIAVPAAASDPSAEHLLNVKNFGAVGDGKTDDTAAFQKAVRTAQQIGYPVVVPAGTYVVTDTITLNSVTLYGTPEAAWTADNCDLPCVKQANMTKPLFDVRSGSLSGLLLDCNGGSKEENKQPAVLITGTGGRVSDMKINNPWIGIFTDDKSNPGRCFIDNCFIVGAYEMGVYVGGTYDVPIVSDVEVWNPDLNRSVPIAFKFGDNDDIRCVNLFAFNATIGFDLVKTGEGPCWGSFTNCSVDYTGTGFYLEKGGHTVTIVGGTYWVHGAGVQITKECTGDVTVSACDMRSNSSACVLIDGGNMVNVTGCNLKHNFASSTAAVSISGGKLVNVSDNIIYSRPAGISITGRDSAIVHIKDNLIYTAADHAIVNTTRKFEPQIEGNTVVEKAALN